MSKNELRKHRIGTAILTILLCVLAPLLVHTNSVVSAEPNINDTIITNTK